ncbi:hypothetical protein [Serratia fonticola]|uniref:hypothetical protein n=1 Tax=Serratia fonticola TaxID=47917 RepID=UPI001C452233|nr:hypothetical protein [Serratia fonticola]QXN65243.1 hypothetical protein J8M99_26135 [Serratia fonticola]
MIKTNDLKDAQTNEVAVMKHVFNNFMEVTTLFFKIVLVFIGSGIALKYISLGVSYLYQSNSHFIFYFSVLVTALLSFSFWFFKACFNSVPHIDNRIDLTQKTKIKFNKILKITFAIKGAFYLILFSSWARVCGDDSIDLPVAFFIVLSGVEHILNMQFLDDVNDEVKEEV